MSRSVVWEWPDFWAWFNTLSSNDKAEALNLVGLSTMGRLTPEQQADVFRKAPEVMLLNLKHLPMVHKKTILILQAERDALDDKMWKAMRSSRIRRSKQ